MDSFKAFVEAVDQTPIQNLVASLKAQYPGLELFVSQTVRDVHVHEIKVPPDNRGQGIGTKVMQAIQGYAQSVGLPVTLSPQPEPRQKARLLKFYKSLGFYNNQGRRKDYSLGGFASGPTWVWRPKKV